MFEQLRGIAGSWFGKDRTYYRAVKSLFGIRANNIELYKLALVHRSASLLLDDGTPINNERLEFLGDAVMEAIVSDFLFIEYPEKDEGFLTQLRSKLVSRATLNDLAVRIGIDRHVIAQGGATVNQKNLFGDALEAIIGAIYLDKGYEYTNRLFINGIIRKHIDLREITRTETDFKSRLIEWSQKLKHGLEFITVPGVRHSSHSPHFQCVVLLNGQPAGEGNGDSKKTAEQAASRATLYQLEGACGFYEPGKTDA